MKQKIFTIPLSVVLAAAFLLGSSSLAFAQRPQNVGDGNGHGHENAGTVTAASDNSDANSDPSGNGASACPGFVPPGHLVAPGWLKHHDDVAPTVPSCETLPHGIAMQLGIEAPPSSSASFAISNVAVTAATSTATVTWNTNRPASSQVFYGTTAAYGSSTALDATRVGAHSETLTGLSPDTAYHFQVASVDAQGDTATSSDMTFTTGAVPDVILPSVSLTAPADGATVSSTVTVAASATDNVAVASVQFMLDGSDLGAAVTSSPYSISWDTTAVTDGSHALTAVAADSSGNTATSTPVTVIVDNAAPVISAIAANAETSSAAIAWTTNEPATSQIFYGTTSAYGSSTVLDATPTTTHEQAIAELAPGTTYHFEVRSADAAGNLATSSDGTFSTAMLPVVSNVTTTAATSTATIDWASNVSTTGILYYSTTTPIDITGTSTLSVTDATLATSHSGNLTGLDTSTTYYFVIQAADGFGDITTTPQMSFTTGS